jgi:hypothetical protein
MLHRINPAAEAALRNVLAFQRKVLAYACRTDLTVPLTREEMNEYFGPQAEWLWKHWALRGRITKLNEVVRTNENTSAGILAAFDNDVIFDAHIDDPAFEFACCGLGADVKDLVNDLLVSFYDLLGQDGGFSAEITGGEVLTRDLVVQEFWMLNSGLKVCPACDGPRPDKTDGKIHSQCDHHFPKSPHSSLSVHPRNLVHVCVDCNVTFKGNRDANEKAHISEMFLPYAREAFGPLEVSALRNAHGVLVVEISDAGAKSTNRIESLDHILRLRERWSDRLSVRVSRSIVGSLQQQSRSAARRGDAAADHLSNIAAQRKGFRASRGKQQDSILAEAYCALLEVDKGELDQVFE